MQNWQERCKGWLHDENNIKGFFGEYRWLSNFHICPVEYSGFTFESSEQAYQAAKCPETTGMYQFRILSPAKAKALGQKVQIRPDWKDVKLDVMYQILQSKFANTVSLRQALIDTGDKYLEETNWWRDRFWGVYNGEGSNNLGKILMQIRKELQ